MRIGRLSPIMPFYEHPGFLFSVLLIGAIGATYATDYLGKKPPSIKISADGETISLVDINRIGKYEKFLQHDNKRYVLTLDKDGNLKLQEIKPCEEIPF